MGLNQESREELEYLFREWEMEQDPEEMIRESMAPVRQAAIGPMLAGRELEELCWEPVALDDPHLRPEWLEEFRQFALTGRDSLTLVGHARFERDGDGWQAALYHRMNYSDFRSQLQKQGLSLPTADEWEMCIRDSAYLIDYLSADLREKPPGRAKMTQADHLPTFMKTAKNRERIVKRLKKLQEG